LEKLGQQLGRLLCTMSVASFVPCAGLAAPFVNLNFEQSTVQPNDPIVVPTSAAFPGWTAWIGNTTSNNVYHDFTGGGEPIVAVFDEAVIDAGFPLLQGNYMAYLSPSTSDVRTALSQVGDIPTGTRSMTLLCDGGAGPPIVKINGTTIPMLYRSGINFNGFPNIYAGDVTAFGGSTVELRLECATRFELHSGRRAFDDVRFSQSPLPEPTGATSILLILGTQMRRRRSRTGVIDSAASPAPNRC
jgi:hypothetical protein